MIGVGSRGIGRLRQPAARRVAVWLRAVLADLVRILSLSGSPVPTADRQLAAPR